MGLTEVAKEVQDLMEGFSDEDDDDEDENGNKEKRSTIYLDDDAPVVEVYREKTIEDMIEEQRAKLSSEGKVGTPVTEQSFRTWRSLKLAQRQVILHSLCCCMCWC
jgi:DRG Family Regulatory Proteins, Tma46